MSYANVGFGPATGLGFDVNGGREGLSDLGCDRYGSAIGDPVQAGRGILLEPSCRRFSIGSVGHVDPSHGTTVILGDVRSPTGLGIILFLMSFAPSAIICSHLHPAVFGIPDRHPHVVVGRQTDQTGFQGGRKAGTFGNGTVPVLFPARGTGIVVRGVVVDGGTGLGPIVMLHPDRSAQQVVSGLIEWKPSGKTL